MNKRLYPPIIEGTIPAFYNNLLTVPFTMNKAVAWSEVSGFAIKIKTVQSNTYIGYATVTRDLNMTDPIPEVVFDLSEFSSRFNVGQYYKIQMAYIDEDGITVGYYSTVGVVKYTTKPVVTIEGLETGKLNLHSFFYIGKYSQVGQDSTEKVYSYCFNIYDRNLRLVQTTGIQLHNSNNDTRSYESEDQFTLEKELRFDETYYIEYVVTTNNGVKEKSPLYRIIQYMSIESEWKINIIPSLNFDNGFINISFKGEVEPETGIEKAVTGMFKICRSQESTDYSEWLDLVTFSLYGDQPSVYSWKDFTIEQGVKYKYSLQQYNGNGLASKRIESEIIMSDFEDMFLYDGERQLKIRFNPKVSSFKTTQLESKVDTIGSKYPFIFKNGNVKYKDFSIGGLISYWMDEDNLFWKPYPAVDEFTINFTGENIYNERRFKLEVMEWLSNGEPKLFRSPPEGNYIISIINVSMSPIDTLGRMLHNFQCNAYEATEYNYENLIKYKFMGVEDHTTSQIKWETIDLTNIKLNTNLLNHVATSLRLEGMIAGDKVYIDDHLPHTSYYTTGYDVVIGATGSYIIELEDNMKIYSVKILTGNQGTLTYTYETVLATNTYDLIKSYSVEDIPFEQFIGPKDLLATINDIRIEVQLFRVLRFSLRPIQIVFYNNGQYYYDESHTIPLVYDQSTIYAVYLGSRLTGEYEIDSITGIKVPIENQIDYYLDGNNQQRYDTIDTTFTINSIVVDLSEIIQYEATNINNLQSLIIGNGIIVETSYKKQIKEYNLENAADIASAKQQYLQAEDALHIITYEYDADTSARDAAIVSAKRSRNTSYNNYISLLEKAIKERQEIYDS